ncbi:MAG: HD domain-containing protein [Arsenophonus sp.]
MVVIKNAHLISEREFSIDKSIPSFNLTNNNSGKKLIELLDYYYNKVQKYENSESLLLRRIAIGEILSILSIDLDSLRSAMSSPSIDVKIITDNINNVEFGKSIHSLVKDAMKINAIRQLNSTKSEKKSFSKVDNIRRIFLSILKDFRCVVIKITEHISYLRKMIKYYETERVLIAKEFLNIYSITNRCINIEQLKWELEDFCFHYLNPDEYKKISELLHERRIYREQYINDFISSLQKCMLQENITAEIYGRPKNIYSIWRKMKKKYLSFDELFDIRAVRIIVECLKDCYVALNIVHTNFCYLPDEFDNYVSNPKQNGYQSIHTVVLGPHDKTIEVQIRTRQMHKNAELGVAAHWKYKEEAVITGK